jgi:hypothetical protein
MTAEVATSAEESAEKIKGVMMTAIATLLSLLEALVAVLIVDLAGLGVDEGFVGFRDLDKLVLGGIIAPIGCIALDLGCG